MEWVETTAKTIDEARNAALDQLGVAEDEAEITVLEEPRPGLFGRLRGQARVRARVRPTQVRPKQDRRRRGRKSDGDTDANTTGTDTTPSASSDADTAEMAVAPAGRSDGNKNDNKNGRSNQRRKSAHTQSAEDQEPTMTNDDARDRDDSRDEHRDEGARDDRPQVSPAEVGAAAVEFMDGLVAAFGATGTATLEIDDLELDVQVAGEELGLLIGPGGRTLGAIQDLARVAAQRRLGDHETRLRIDVAGYRARREIALAAFARDIAGQVRATGTARSLDAMTSADRKVVHDVLNDEEGVASRSVGEDPDRRIIVEPI